MRFDNLSAQAMQKSLDALWMRTKVITNNIANYETPGYMAMDFSFELVLSDVNKSGQPQKAAFRTSVIEKSDSTVRPDGNNVNMDKEQLELWRTQSQYAFLVNKINGQYNNLRYVIKQAVK
ncbi:MAG: flagellar basal body rod protein FlgB [Angelakisella sp.]